MAELGLDVQRVTKCTAVTLQVREIKLNRASGSIVQFRIICGPGKVNFHYGNRISCCRISEQNSLYLLRSRVISRAKVNRKNRYSSSSENSAAGYYRRT